MSFSHTPKHHPRLQITVGVLFIDCVSVCVRVRACPCVCVCVGKGKKDQATLMATTLSIYSLAGFDETTVWKSDAHECRYK